MIRLLALALLAVPLVAAAGTYNENKQQVTQDCAKDPIATLNGNDLAVVLTGTCTKVAVNGNHITVKASAIGQLSVSGNDNTVAVATVDTLNVPGNRNNVAVNNPPKHASNSGTDNKVSTGSNP